MAMDPIWEKKAREANNSQANNVRALRERDPRNIADVHVRKEDWTGMDGELFYLPYYVPDGTKREQQHEKHCNV